MADAHSSLILAKFNLPVTASVEFHMEAFVNKLILIVFFFISSSVLANTVNVHEELTATLENIRIQNNIPSMSVAVITSGELTYIKGFGFIDAEVNKPTDSESLFRTASISKLFTAQAIMQLVEKNKIKLNEKIGHYIPRFQDTNITVKELLTHSSGISDSIKPIHFDKQRTINSYLNSVTKVLPKNTENKTFEYSDTNFNILGAIISAVSHLSYEEYIDKNILKPAKMKKSGFFNSDNSHFSDTKPTFNGKIIPKVDQRPYDFAFNPSEGLISNAQDLSNWLRLTLVSDPSLLKELTYKDMLEPEVKTSWGEIYMGLGWQVYKSSKDKIARHPGSIRGYKSLVITYPDRKDALIILTNSSNTPRWEIAKSITKILKQNAEW
ncbi:serine hydrolase domain-containing protein [Pseudoalteromonas spongiae]|uniref:serine hydrolase domain-containing protein n=1 Tax=Pseudoalteromonas spongiae TaxID=298657 RepID=UPI001E2F33BE|nr:serine hydrolase domain-containing protein [Pseudoalteromonas spongiae]